MSIGVFRAGLRAPLAGIVHLVSSLPPLSTIFRLLEQPRNSTVSLESQNENGKREQTCVEA
jgi:hypothetical protein